MIFSDPKTARKINRLRVLNCIRVNRLISRAGLSRELVINKVSISEIVKSILDEGLIVEAGKKSGALGRQPVMLKIQKQAGFTAVLDVGLKNTTRGIGNLAGELVRFERAPTPHFIDEADFVDFLADSITRLKQRMKNPERCLGCAVSINADIDCESGTLLHSEDWDWEHLPIAALLQQRTGMPVVIDANVRTMLLAEKWFGNVDSNSSIFYINWGQKIGAAQMAGNTILSVNSEFGHTPIHASEAATGISCFCGKSGCLEASAGGWSLQDRGNKLLGTVDMTVKQMYRKSPDIRELAELFQSAAADMGQAAAVAANITKPGSIVIGGGIAGIGPEYYRTMNESFFLHAAPKTRSSLIISQTMLGDRAGLLGSVALGLDRFLYRQTLLDSLEQDSGPL